VPFSDTDAAAVAWVEERVLEIESDPESLLLHIAPDFSTRDPEFTEDWGTRILLMEAYREAVRKHKGSGWVGDVLALRRDWGFQLGDIPKSCEVDLWQGEEDTYTKRVNVNTLSNGITHARVHIGRGLGHFGAFEVTLRAISALSSGRPMPNIPLLRDRFPLV
jgi:hypothetical protein